MKPTVRFKDFFGTLVVGKPAFVFPVDHPSPVVSNKNVVRTSKVIQVFEDGSFETKNTIYKPE